jgi:phage gp29-like protein
MGVKKLSNTSNEMIEIGDTGSLRNSGYTFEEFVPELRSRNGAEIFDEMRKNDATINGVLTLMNQLFYNVSWKYSTDCVDNDLEKRGIIVEQMLNDMEKTFTQTMNDALTFLPHGYSLLEIVWKQRLGLHTDRRFYSKHNYRDGLGRRVKFL